MKQRAPVLGLALGFALLGGPPPLQATALDDLINAAGQGLPNVPDASPPQRVDGEDTGDSGYDYGEEERLRQAQAAREQREREERERQRLEQERLEKERQRLERERLAREEQERLRREAEARRTRLRQQAATARQHWIGEDERNRAAFDDVFANSAPAAAAEGDANVVDLSTARTFTPALLRSASPPVPSLRIKPPPLPPPEFTLSSAPAAPEPVVLPFWRPDWERKLTDMGFAYASLYLKAKIDGLGSIPEILKDSLDLRTKLGRRFTDHLDNVFATAQLATDPHADLGALADRAERQFRSFAAAVDEDARNGVRDTIATTGGGALGDGAEAAEFGIAAGREHLQDLQELKKWCDENPPRRR